MAIEYFVRLCALCLYALVTFSDAKTVPSEGKPGSHCLMGGGVGGRCEEVEACLQEGGVVQRSGEVKLCQAQGTKIFVCCRKPHRIAEELCAGWAGYWRGPDKKCSSDTPLIIGGKDANVGEFPHIAILGRQSGRGEISWSCGGSLVSPHFVLTAAHCVKFDELNYWIELGVHDRDFTSDKELPRLHGSIPRSIYGVEELDRMASLKAPVKQRFQVIEVIRHPHYHAARKYHDIALVRLERPAILTRRVLPACLPTKSQRNLTGREVVVAGWGRTGTSLVELTSVLQKVTLPVQNLLQCQATIAERDRLVASVGLLEDQICAGAKGKDSCKGDSGGPLMTQEPRYGSLCEQTVDGVVSFGPGCGDFGIYARVGAYLDWITGYIAPDTSS